MVNLIIPVYKSRETLPMALRSLLCQTKKMFITTLVQDCDGEDYTDIVEKYRNEGLVINLIQTPHNGGPGAARQYGIDHCGMCEYVMFMDADDMLLPRAIEILHREIKGNDLDIVYSDFICERNHQPGFTMRAKETPCTWLHGKIYKVKYLKDNNIRFLEDLRWNEDAYFNLVAHNSTEKKAFIEEATYLWRDNPNSVTRSKDFEGCDFFVKSWIMYIESQVKALLKIQDLLGEVNPKLVAFTIINVYNHTMIALHRGFDLSPAIEHLRNLKNDEKIQKVFDTKEFWQTINLNLKASILTNDNELIFSKVRFPEWLNQYVIKEIKNERVYS